MSTLKIIEKRDPIIEKLSLPVSAQMLERYRKIANELDKRKLTKLHDLTRERLANLLTEVEQQLGA